VRRWQNERRGAEPSPGLRRNLGVPQSPIETQEKWLESSAAAAPVRRGLLRVAAAIARQMSTEVAYEALRMSNSQRPYGG
jgi:hypothetical protein